MPKNKLILQSKASKLMTAINKAIERLGAKIKKANPCLVRCELVHFTCWNELLKITISDHIRIMEMFCAYIQQNSPRDIEKSQKMTSNHCRT